MNEPKTVGGYIRVSTEEQSRNGLSLESQRADIEDYCRRMGYRIERFYIDAGITARKSLYKRVAFMDMMRDVQSKRINHIVVLRLDRFFRNVYDYHRMMHEHLDPAGCGWSAVKEDYDTTTTNGRLMINLRLSIAEQECDQDSDRIKDVFANRIKEGYVVTGHPPLGYKIENKRLVPDENADLVREIFDSFLRLNSIRLVLLDLRERLHVDMKYDRINSTLRKKIYIGHNRSNKNYCEPIVSEETFNAVQRGLDNNIRARGTRKVYIFSRLIKCACCGHSMAGSSPNAYKNCNPFMYYRCNFAYQNLTCNNRHNTNEAAVEQYLLENIETLIRNYIYEVEAKERSAPAPRKGNRKQIEAKIERVMELYINKVIELDEFRRRRDELQAQIVDDEVEPKKTDLTAVKAFLNSGFKEVYGNLSPLEKRTLWRKIVKEIICEGSEVKEVVFL